MPDEPMTPGHHVRRKIARAVADYWQNSPVPDGRRYEVMVSDYEQDPVVRLVTDIAYAAGGKDTLRRLEQDVVAALVDKPEES